MNNISPRNPANISPGLTSIFWILLIFFSFCNSSISNLGLEKCCKIWKKYNLEKLHFLLPLRLKSTLIVLNWAEEVCGVNGKNSKNIDFSLWGYSATTRNLISLFSIFRALWNLQNVFCTSIYNSTVFYIIQYIEQIRTNLLMDFSRRHYYII